MKPNWGNHFWTRGYFVSTIGEGEDKIVWYMTYQEEQEKKQEDDGKNFRLF